MHVGTIIFKKCHIQEKQLHNVCISGVWLSVGLVRSMFSKIGFFRASFCDDFRDLTSPTSNHIHIAISVVYVTF